jgi:hypothetical protein
MGSGNMNRHTEQQVDRLLMERGEYHPLEFLLQEGRLSYGDYEAWRNGEVRDLCELLFGDQARIVATLEQAAVYLQRLGWESERLVYRQRGGADARPLRFSQDNRLDDCFHQAYLKPRDQSQLDLFTDTSTTYLVNGITQALKTLNTGDARHALQQLSEAAPDHAHLGELERLVEAAESLEHPVVDVEAEMRRLVSETSELAERHLKKADRQLLIPLWRRLTTALRGQTFDPSRPELHASHTAMRAGDWQGVRQAVESEADWQCQALLLERHARACTHLSDRAAALRSWCLLCWRFPLLGERIESCDDSTFGGGWRAFLDLEPELPVEDFPAWLLLQSPGLASIAPDAEACPERYRILLQLQKRRQLGTAAATDVNAMALRAALKRQAPLLFQYYLDSLDRH